MPELPEVETIVRALDSGIRYGGLRVTGQKIHRAQVLWAGTLEKIAPGPFQERISGQIISNVNRRGKFLVFTLNRDTLLIHLRMSGDLRVEEAFGSEGDEIAPHQHDRLLLIFESQQRLAFNDTRKFGRVWLTDDPASVLDVLGPEPLDSALTAERFHAMLQKHRRMLKPLLMDQHFLAGMGNIYTDEALFRARLHPCSSADLLTPLHSALLLKEIRNVLTEGIQRNGASIDWVYRGGDFQNHFNVYGRKDENCPLCGAPIERLLVGQRGTHICPNCQRK
jgi:formamidopyrimidine-DNA glycosylase